MRISVGAVREDWCGGMRHAGGERGGIGCGRGEGVRTLKSVPGAEPDARLGRADGVHDGVDDLKAKPAAVLHRSPVAVRALVRDVLQELMDKVAVRACVENSIRTRD
jgi:hypothetical protein